VPMHEPLRQPPHLLPHLAPPSHLAQPPHLVALWQAAFLSVLPSGGQRAARRNAWAGRSRDAALARAWREADAAVAPAAHGAAVRGG